MRGHPGLVFRKKYGHRVILRKRQQWLDAVIDELADHLIKKEFVAVIADGKLQLKSMQTE
jgi:hypothetical protein